MLNHFVFEENDNLVNITTKKTLPKDCPEDELRKNFFLAGQEQESIDHFLFGQDKKTFSIDLIPTWECNLRCNHCFVLHELKKKDTGSINCESLASFIGRLVSEYPSVRSGSVQFIGGEPALRAKENVNLIKRLRQIRDVKISFRATSNGTVLNDDVMEFFSELDGFIISMDGPEIVHNMQRKSLGDNEANPFKATLKTLEKLVGVGMRDKIIVQASMQEKFMTKENLLEFYKILLMHGIRFENIIPGFVCPTKQNPKLDEGFVDVHKTPRTRPCCKYRHMVNFVVDTSNNVYCDYFEANGKNLLGKLDDPIKQMASNHESIIRKSFSVLNDPKCKTCPVIGMCWGWCANTKGLNPSDHCDQQLLIEKVNKNAEKNNLVNFMRNSRKNDVTAICSK